MASFGDEILRSCDEIVQRWYERWRETTYPHPELEEAALKDSLPLQLRVVGDSLRDMRSSENPDEMWREFPGRLDPEARVSQEVPIEEVVQEYRILMAAVRDWIVDRNLQPTFDEYSYLNEAIFELTAESVRRYARYHAEKTKEERSHYLAGITHQMRSPLTALSLQLEAGMASSTPPGKDLLRKLQRHVQRLTLLVNGVMRLERFKPEEVPVRPQPVRVARMVENVLADQEYAATRKGLRLEVSVSHTLEMEADPELFVDALGNLVDNAIKYTDQGFVRVDVDDQHDPDGVTFRVSDSGPGISEERKAALFKPAPPDKRGGAGIGLAIVRHAVRAQGGEVGVDSSPGEGTCFWFRLPRHVRPVAEAQQDEGMGG